MNKFFSLVKETQDIQEGKVQEYYKSKLISVHLQKIKNLAKELVRLPAEGEIFFLQSDNSFNAFTFIPLICKTQKVKHLYVATYNITRKIIASLKELSDGGQIEQITILISDSFVTRNPSTCDLLKSWVTYNPNIKILFAWSHAKVSLLETEENNYLVEGSGNWSDNAFYEQYIFLNNPEVFEFRKQLFTHSKIKFCYGKDKL